jgi:hypothetical protein
MSITTHAIAPQTAAMPPMNRIASYHSFPESLGILKVNAVTPATICPCYINPMPRGPKGEKRPADVIGAAVMVGRY